MRVVGVESPAVQWFRGDDVWFHSILTQVAVTGGGDGHTDEWIKSGFFFKQLFELQAAFFLYLDIRFAISHELFSKIARAHLLGMPGFKRFATAH